jgi:hypothetical protein
MMSIPEPWVLSVDRTQQQRLELESDRLLDDMLRLVKCDHLQLDLKQDDDLRYVIQSTS